jgi:solute carrier family 6 amino acid transporter-like protein 5/7/9/14
MKLVNIFSCCIFPGVGIGMVIVSGLVCVYYNVIVAWTLYYLFMSFRAVLPWSTCGNWWNTDHCLDVERSVVMAGRNASQDSNSTSLISNLTAGANYTLLGNATWLTGNTSGLIRKEDLISSSEEFWE